MKRVSKLFVRAAMAAGFAAAALVGTAVIWRSSEAVRSAAEGVRDQHEFRFVIQSLALHANYGFEPVSSPQVFIQAARFQDHIYLAGPAGLIEYDPRGSLVRQFSVGSDSPSSQLVALAPAVLADSRTPELVIATANDGLIAFDGQNFRQILPQSADARAVTTILSLPSGHLLIGTKKRGVLSYDGRRLAVLHPLLDAAYVTALAGNESDLWVGTLNRGVFHFHAGEVDGFSEAEGMPDPQVEALAVSGDTTYVGTATGIAVFDTGRFSRVLAPGIFATALLATATNLYVGSEDQGILTIPLEGRHPNPNLGQGDQLAEVRQLFASGDDLFAVVRDGLYRLHPHAFSWERVLETSSAVLSDRNISALGADASGQLWVGFFDRGLDLLASDNRRTRHIDDEHVFCVNRIFPEPKSGTVDVATANGLVRFDPSGSEQQILTRADGLIADHVTDIVEYRGGLALATPAGLTFLDASGARSMYTFHGLVNNHVYALGVSGDDLLVGTLGGLSAINKGDVQANYTAGGSGLKHNWITAVVPVGDEWMVGTYGAGVLGMNRAGHFQSFEKATADVEINPNAMLVTQGHVFAGTLGNGLYIYDRTTQRWTAVSDGLPSTNVTALAESSGYIYVGTDNGLVRIQEQKLSR